MPLFVAQEQLPPFIGAFGKTALALAVGGLGDGDGLAEGDEAAVPSRLRGVAANGRFVERFEAAEKGGKESETADGLAGGDEKASGWGNGRWQNGGRGVDIHAHAHNDGFKTVISSQNPFEKQASHFVPCPILLNHHIIRPFEGNGELAHLFNGFSHGKAGEHGEPMEVLGRPRWAE